MKFDICGKHNPHSQAANPGDFGGDGKTDVPVYRGGNRNPLQSTPGFTAAKVRRDNRQTGSTGFRTVILDGVPKPVTRLEYLFFAFVNASRGAGSKKLIQP
jgi:hypothetical protein